MSNIYKPTSGVHEKIISQKKKLRPVSSFKRSFKHSNSIQTNLRKQNTSILHSGDDKTVRDLRQLRESIDISLMAGYCVLNESSLYHSNSVANVYKNKNSIRKINIGNIHTINKTITKPDKTSELGKNPTRWINTKKGKI